MAAIETTRRIQEIIPINRITHDLPKQDLLTQFRAQCEFQVDGTIVAVDAQFPQWMGYRPEELKGKNHSLFLDETARQSEEQKEFWAKLVKGLPQTAEVRRVGKGGKEVWLASAYYPVLDPSGVAYRILQFAADVTERKQCERDAQSQMAAVMRSRMALDLQLDGTIFGANTNFLQVMGYTLEEIRGKNHKMFLEEGLRNGPEEKQLWTKLARGEFQVTVCKRLGKGGRPLWLNANYNPLLDANGKPYRVQVLATDVTEQTNSFTGQIEAINRSQLVSEYAMDGAILNVNENFEKLLGYGRAELIGKHVSIFEDEETRNNPECQAARKKLWERLNQGQYCNGEARRVTKQGTEIWIQYSYNPLLDHDGKPYRVVNYFVDITERKKTSREITQIAESLASASEELTASSQHMNANAERTSTQANTVAEGAGRVDRSLQTVAAGTEEMTASIKEIAKNAMESFKVASGAVKVADEANQIVGKLGDSSSEIGQVIKVITTIARQTNLLALNATIEAARAGEAGKGFAVVAGEVKELAKQTAAATEEIGRKIEAIQLDTTGAVAAIEQISTVIKQVNDISNSIATAVEEQNATTNEISRNVNEAAKESTEIAKNIGAVAETATSTVEGAKNSLKEANTLLKMANDLRKLVQS